MPATVTRERLALLRQRVGASGHIVGIEQSPEMIAQARKIASWGGNAVIGEYSSSGVVLRMTIHGSFSYRAYPVLPGTLDIADLRAGMDAQAP